MNSAPCATFRTLSRPGMHGVLLDCTLVDYTTFLKARPPPCAVERLDCPWEEVPSLRELLKSYRFDYLLIADGRKYLVVNTESVNRCLLILHDWNSRQAGGSITAKPQPSMLCDGLSAQLTDSGS